MTFVDRSRGAVGALAAVGVFLVAAYPARAGAATVSYHLDGKVMAISGAATSALATLGVHNGADVDIDWTIELTTPVSFDSGAPDNRKEYMGAITAFEIRVGTWTATRDAPSLINIVTVADAISSTPQDAMHLAQGATDTDLVLRGSGGDGSLGISLDLLAPNGGASSNNALGQNPNGYPSRSGYVVGTNGIVYFEVTGSGTSGGGTSDPTAKCRTAQIASGGAFCQATFKCLSKYAKAPAKDPGALVLDACREKARQKFLTSYDRAAAAAAKKSLSCGDTEPGATFDSNLDEAVADIVGDVDAIDPEVPVLNSAWYTAAAAMCSTGVKAESSNQAKPNESKRSEARAKGRTKLVLAAGKAVDKAESKGVVFVAPPDVPDFADSIDDLIDDIAAELNGD